MEDGVDLRLGTHFSTSFDGAIGHMPQMVSDDSHRHEKLLLSQGLGDTPRQERYTRRFIWPWEFLSWMSVCARPLDWKIDRHGGLHLQHVPYTSI